MGKQLIRRPVVEPDCTGSVQLSHIRSNDTTTEQNEAFNGAVDGTGNGFKSKYEGDARKVIGIDGRWYDVTEFVDIHPGGSVIEHFVGRDASEVFHANGHNPLLLKHRKVVGTYLTIDKHSSDEDFAELHRTLKKKGFFETDFVYYTQKLALCAAFLAACFACVVLFEQWYIHYVGAVFMYLFWQQCGFIMHDIMHHQVFRDATKDRAGGVFIGTFCLGISAHWWQEEHVIHHALTNTVNVAKRFADPQMWESVWAQNEKLFPLFTNAIQPFFIRVQHITFIPFISLFGRATIVIESYAAERRWYEWAAIVAHWTWMSWLLSFLPTWREVIIFYLIASSLEGVLHFQLVLSHYCRLFVDEDDLPKWSWTRFQVLSNMNIDTPEWMDWYWGGLNFHIEHHLFPKMACHRLRAASPYVRAVCEKHNIEYASCGFLAAMSTTLHHLRHTAKHFSLDPR